MNIIYDTQSTINENINLRLNGLRPRSEASEELKNLNGKWIQICMHGFRPFSGSPGLRAGPGAADFLHVRHPIPQSRFASVGECKPRSRPGRVVGESGWGGGVPVYRACRGRRLARGRAGCWRIRKGGCPGLPKTRGACLFVRQSGGQSDADTGVGRPESGGADECRVRLRPDAWSAGICVDQSPEPRRRLAGKRCLLWVRALCRACCPQKMKGAPKGSLPHQKLTLKNYPLFGRPP